MKEKDDVILSQREQQRLRVICEVQKGQLSVSEAAVMLDISQRHLRRLSAGFAAQGAGALAHGNRGRPSARRISDELREQVRQLGSGRYAGCNDTHFAELLLLDLGIELSRKSVERIRRGAGQPPKRRRRPPRHRSRRDRMPREGMLLQVDASLHHWFGPELPRLTLVGAIDDATGKVAGLFREREDAQGYLLLLGRVLRTQGVPLALYRDRHGIFQVNPQTPVSLEGQLEGREAEPTQFGRALQELGIDSIAAHSPEAKGRIERLWGTFQDRLVAELALAGIKEIRAANRFLPGFLKRFDARFAVQPEEPGLAYRPLDPGLDLDRVLSFRYQRVVARDNTVSLGGHLIQIPPGPRRRSYAAARVWVHEFLDGSLGVWYQDQWLVPCLRSHTANARVRARARKPQLPERPDTLNPPLPLEQPANATAAIASRPPPKPHPWRIWRANTPSTQPARTESLSS